MSLIPTLLLLLALLYALYGASWWVAALLLGLPRAPALHWMGYSLAGCLGAVLFLSEGGLPLWLVLPGRNLAILLAAMLVRRGLALFMRQDTNDLEQALLLGVSAAALALIGLDPAEQWIRASMLSLAIGWVLLRTGLEQIVAVGREFGRLTGWLIGLAPLLLGAVFASRAAMALVLLPTSALWSVTADAGANAMLLVAVLLISILFQFSLFYIVILRTVLKLRTLSRQDPLTRLLNRRAWLQAAQAERLRLRRAQQSTALLAVDIDHFKRINERHGHAEGDQVLVAVSRCLEQTARATDVVARLGGDEFALLLPDTDRRGAAEAAERLRLAVAGLHLQVDNQRVALTVSVGVAVAGPDAVREVSFSALQGRADAALFAAKSSGRNQVVMAAELPPAAA